MNINTLDLNLLLVLDALQRTHSVTLGSNYAFLSRALATHYGACAMPSETNFLCVPIAA